MASSDTDHKGEAKSFWSTLPGILTGCAALITAVGGLIGALAAAGMIGPDADVPTSVPEIATPLPTREVASINISGSWLGANGLTYVITQSGHVVTIQEISPVYGVTANGEGTVSGTEVDITYSAVDGSIGIASLIFSEATGELSGTFSNLTTGLATPAILYRQD